uniref:Uncharacterized protein n=1 Tax=Corvus moneduloides TaxID=1196302 RepID=A0A8C3GZW7_CORMO
MFQPSAKRCFTIESLVGKDTPLGPEDPPRPAALAYPGPAAAADAAAFAPGFQGAAGRALYGSAELVFPEAVGHPALPVGPPQLGGSALPHPHPFFGPQHRDPLNFYPWVLRNRFFGHRFQARISFICSPPTPRLSPGLRRGLRPLPAALGGTGPAPSGPGSGSGRGRAGLPVPHSPRARPAALPRRPSVLPSLSAFNSLFLSSLSFLSTLFRSLAAQLLSFVILCFFPCFLAFPLLVSFFPSPFTFFSFLFFFLFFSLFFLLLSHFSSLSFLVPFPLSFSPPLFSFLVLLFYFFPVTFSVFLLFYNLFSSLSFFSASHLLFPFLSSSRCSPRPSLLPLFLSLSLPSLWRCVQPHRGTARSQEGECGTNAAILGERGVPGEPPAARPLRPQAQAHPHGLFPVAAAAPGEGLREEPLRGGRRAQAAGQQPQPLRDTGESLVPEPEDQVEEAEHGAEGSKAFTVWGDPACQCRLHRQQGARGGHRGRGALSSRGDWAGF